MAYITQLDSSVPVITDPVANGAEEIRKIKESLKQTFPFANSALNVSNDSIQIALQESLPELVEAVRLLTLRVEALENA